LLAEGSDEVLKPLPGGGEVVKVPRPEGWNWAHHPPGGLALQPHALLDRSVIGTTPGVKCEQRHDEQRVGIQLRVRVLVHQGERRLTVLHREVGVVGSGCDPGVDAGAQRRARRLGERLLHKPKAGLGLALHPAHAPEPEQDLRPVIARRQGGEQALKLAPRPSRVAGEVAAV
jgi:hypothetical protein